MTILCLDIDHFKALNTKYTETTVDETILRPFQQLLRDLCAHRGEAYCHGGDQFGVLLRNSELKEGAEFAERLRSQLGAALFTVGNETIRVTVSIGVASWPTCGETYQEVVGAANKAENEAKATRNVVRLALPTSMDAGEAAGAPPVASDEEIQKLQSWLESPSAEVRRDAAGDLLALINKKRVFHYEPLRGAIRRLMKDPDEEVRLKALEIHTALMRWERTAVKRYWS